jgi:hypothetical protein
MVNGMLDPEMIGDNIKIVDESIRDKIQVNLRLILLGGMKN